MKGWMIVAGLGMLLLTGSGSAQSVPGQGFSELICQLGVAGSGTFVIGNGQIVVSIVDSGASPGGTGTATVTIQHGKSGSTHTLTYQDTSGDGMLDCGDTVVSFT
jgi:hypothetical protein